MKIKRFNENYYKSFEDELKSNIIDFMDYHLEIGTWQYTDDPKIDGKEEAAQAIIKYLFENFKSLEIEYNARKYNL